MENPLFGGDIVCSILTIYVTTRWDVGFQIWDLLPRVAFWRNPGMFETYYLFAKYIHFI
ncbi:hypothetical protein [Rhodohalobacter sp.]|uniref:hypothetical protein n=1 Tax=Rhodohalobacter sp. TaxID=1974210 RepID=UPI00356669CA